ncbi:MAG TPA: hypothetical protein VGI19_02120 [Candidatus Cybelea sp.]
MPSTDTNACFNVAVKHLFRHLHEPHVLRRNYLVEHFFETASERDALERVHELVRRGAAYCRDLDVAAGREERALRQHAILIQQCLDQHPIREVAAKLGISYFHCYRQRAEICRRVARYLCEHDDDPVLDPLPELDEFACRMARVAHQAGCLDAAAVYRESDELVRSASSAQQTIEALRLSATLALRFGDLSRAERIYDSARALWGRELANDPSRACEIAHACIDLIGAKLSYYRMSLSQALGIAQRAMARLQPLAGDAPARVRQLYVESLFELGAAFWNNGEFEKGYDRVAEADTQLSRMRSVPPRFRIRVAIEVWQMRDYLLMSSKSWYPSWQRRRGLTNAFDQAYAAGAFLEAARALLALTEHYAFAGHDDETLKTARLAMTVAGQEPSAGLRSQIAIHLAMMLLWTRHWEQAFSFLPRSQQLDDCDVYHRELAAYFAAERAFRRGAYQDAWNLTKDEDATGYVALSVRKKLIAAATAHELERRRDAGVLIEATVPAAKRLASAPILRDTYRIAAKVTGDSRFKREANELARLLTA